MGNIGKWGTFGGWSGTRFRRRSQPSGPPREFPDRGPPLPAVDGPRAAPPPAVELHAACHVLGRLGASWAVLRARERGGVSVRSAVLRPSPADRLAPPWSPRRPIVTSSTQECPSFSLAAIVDPAQHPPASDHARPDPIATRPAPGRLGPASGARRIVPTPRYVWQVTPARRSVLLSPRGRGGTPATRCQEVNR